MLRQSWDTVHRPSQSHLQWGAKQQEALDKVRSGYNHDDEEIKRASWRFLYIDGKPGSGKSAVLLECAVRACPDIQVLIICPNWCISTCLQVKVARRGGRGTY